MEVANLRNMYKAELKNYRQSPQKVRLVANLVRGKKVDRALVELGFLNKKAAFTIKKLINSAVANATHNFKAEKSNLIIKEIRVDESKTLKRWRAGARGRAFSIKKRTSRIFVALADGEKVVKKEAVKKTQPKQKTKEIKKTQKSIKKK